MLPENSLRMEMFFTRRNCFEGDGVDAAAVTVAAVAAVAVVPAAEDTGTGDDLAGGAGEPEDLAGEPGALAAGAEGAGDLAAEATLLGRAAAGGGGGDAACCGAFDLCADFDILVSQLAANHSVFRLFFSSQTGVVCENINKCLLLDFNQQIWYNLQLEVWRY